MISREGALGSSAIEGAPVRDSKLICAWVVIAVIHLSGAFSRWVILAPGLYSAITVMLSVIAIFIILSRSAAVRLSLGANIWLLVIPVYAAISLLWADDTSVAMTAILQFVSTMLLGLAAATLRQSSVRSLVKWTALALLALSVVLAVAAPAIGVAVFELDGELASRPVGVFSWNSSLGLTAGVAALLSFQVWLDERRARDLFLSVLAVIVLVYSESATSILATFAGMFVMIVFSFKHRVRIIITFGFVVFLLIISGVIDLVVDVVFDALGRGSDLTGRSYIWSVALESIQDAPWLGGGIGASLNVGLLGFDPGHSHNGYLQLILELGGIGALIVCLALLTMFFRSLRGSEGVLIGLLFFFLVLNYANSYTLEYSFPLFLLFWAGFASDVTYEKQRFYF